jgi:hypothetical protein
MPITVSEGIPGTGRLHTAAVGSVALLLIIGVAATVTRDVSVFGYAPYAAVLGALIALLAGSPRGLLWLWVIMAVIWLAFLRGALSIADWNIAEGVRLLHDVFPQWSCAALALIAATLYHLDGARKIPRLSFRAGAAIGIWMVLLAISSYLGRFAPDVGMNPRDHPVVAWTLPPLITVTPFIVSWWMVRRVRSTTRAPAGRSSR